jgi:4-amino-4-deoxy-L-arabinose transferase-like glycosyltransferase
MSHDHSSPGVTVERRGRPLIDLPSVLALGILLVISLAGLGRDLWTPDEPREAEISREMWLAPSVIPSLNGAAFVEKPPLYYWTVASVFALVGGPSVAAARAVSGAAGFITLLLVFLWGRREFSSGVGLVAAIGLATSVQFMTSSHWIVIDPLLTLFTTAALWAGSELVRGHGSRRTLLTFFGALALALCTKGLIGPLLVAAGLLAFAAAKRSLAPIKLVKPLAGIALMLVTTAALAALLGAESGLSAVREWLWVNHVERFVNPTAATGHDQPVYYYLTNLPMAVFPWWAPFAALFRPSLWRRAPTPEHEAKVYLATMCLGMVLLLSASATKRSLYLLPLLPPLFLLLATVAGEWWEGRTPGPLRGWVWWAQVGCVVALAAGPAALALGYLRVVDPLSIVFLGTLAVLTTAIAVYSRRGDASKALGALGACAIAVFVGAFGITARLVASQKDLSPFVAWVGTQIPLSQPIYVLGKVDETLEAIVPFVTGRAAVPVSSADIETIRPYYVLVQGEGGRGDAPALNAEYEPVRDRTFGPDRYMALWARRRVAPRDEVPPERSD